MINKVTLPDYSRKEDWVNSITHMVGGGFAVFALVLCLHRSYVAQSWRYLVVSLVYALSMVTVYSVSSIYHGLNPHKGKKIMRVVDHSAIYLLIAGCITPYALIAIYSQDPFMGWITFGVSWGAAILGIVLTWTGFERFKTAQMFLYIAIGWAMIIAIKPLFTSIGVPGLILTVAGGVVYTLGAIVYGIGSKIRYVHSIFHIFVIVGSIIHFFAIYLYILVV